MRGPEDPRTTRQLAVIAEVNELLDGVSWWLFGGWAIDFHAGRVLRSHSDIEAFVLDTDAELVRSKLVGAGFQAPAPLHPEEGQPFLKDGEELGIWFTTHTPAGLRLCGRWCDWALPEGSFTGGAKSIGDVALRPVSVACLIELKRGFPDQPAGAPLRLQDVHDLNVLGEMLPRGGR